MQTWMSGCKRKNIVWKTIKASGYISMQDFVTPDTSQPLLPFVCAVQCWCSQRKGRNVEKCERYWMTIVLAVWHINIDKLARQRMGREVGGIRWIYHTWRNQMRINYSWNACVYVSEFALAVHMEIFPIRSGLDFSFMA